MLGCKAVVSIYGVVKKTESQPTPDPLNVNRTLFYSMQTILNISLETCGVGSDIEVSSFSFSSVQFYEI